MDFNADNIINILSWAWIFSIICWMLTLISEDFEDSEDEK